VDGSGNVIITGNFLGAISFGGAELRSGPSPSMFLAKLDAEGAHVWSRNFNSNTSGVMGNGVAVDPDGNVIVTGGFNGTVNFGGRTFTSTGGADMYVAKFDADGSHVWSKAYGTEGIDRWDGASVAVDDSGDIAIAGVTYKGSTDWDALVAKFDADGRLLWRHLFGDGDDQRATSVAVDGSGSVVAAGCCKGSVDFGGGTLTSAGDFDIWVAKFDADGNHLWSQRFGDASKQMEVHAAVDGSGNVVLAGYYDGVLNFGGGDMTSEGGDTYAAKFNAEGDHIWSRRFGGELAQQCVGVAADDSGNIVIAGRFQGAVDFGGGKLRSAGNFDIFVAKFDAGGSHIWSYSPGGEDAQKASSVAVDGSGNVVLTGDFRGMVNFGDGALTGYHGDVFVAKLPASGEGVDPPPLCHVDPNSLDFGRVGLSSESRELTFKIHNTGGGTLEGRVDLSTECNTYECPIDWSIPSGGGLFWLKEGGSKEVMVKFLPSCLPGPSRCLVDLGVQNRLVFVANRTSGVSMHEAFDPADPSRGRVHTTTDAYGVFISGHYAYVADGRGGLRIMNIVDPSHPVSLGSCATPHHAQDVHVVGRYAYVTAYNAGLRVIDIRSRTSPREVGSLVIPGKGYAYGVFVTGTRAYVAASEAGLAVIDISNPTTPTRVGTYDTPNWAWDVVVSGDYAYVADGWGLIVLDISGPGDPTYVGGYQIGPWSYGVWVAGDYAYLGNSTDGLRVIDVSDPANPVLRGTCDTPGFAFGVVVEGSIAFVADGEYGLQVIDVLDPSNPTILKTIDTPGTATRLAIKSGNAVSVSGMAE